MAKTKQKWHCDLCKKAGEVEYEEGSTPMDRLNLIFCAHERASPECKQVAGLIEWT